MSAQISPEDWERQHKLATECLVARHEGYVEIIRCRGERHWSTPKIVRWLRDAYPDLAVPSESAINNHFAGSCGCAR
jgi:hypothetical protein